MRKFNVSMHGVLQVQIFYTIKPTEDLKSFQDVNHFILKRDSSQTFTMLPKLSSSSRPFYGFPLDR